jgi:hypothetical protein
VLLELSPKVTKRIDQEVGIRDETDPIFGEYEHFELKKKIRKSVNSSTRALTKISVFK